MRPLIRHLGTALGATVVGAVVGTLVMPTVTTAAPASPAWRSCDGLPLECATVSVPLDYRDPGGTKIDIAVSRKKAADPALRRGVLLLNPGGPGGAGLDMPLFVGQLAPKSVTDRYDVIGFDPRGIGRSTPNTCGLTAQQANMSKVIPFPAPNGDISGNVAYAKQIAKQCFEHSGARLPHITTANTARDMDQIRVALGEQKISYYGVSYGSYLGAVYTTLFPQRSDRMILDSVVDPRDVWRSVWQKWGPATEERFEDFAKFAAAQDATYGLGSTPAAVRKTYLDLAARLDKTPVDIWTGNMLRARTRGGLYSDPGLPAVAQLMHDLRQGTPSPVTMPPMDQSSAATMWGIACNDADWPRSIGLHQAQVLWDKYRYPITNGLPSNIFPCAFWPTEPMEPPVEITDRGPRNVLLTQNLRDPATPLSGAKAMRGALGDRAKLVTADQGGHGAYIYTRNTCLTAVATDFLVTGKLPDKDVACGSETSLSAADNTTDNRDELVQQLHDRQFPL